MNTIGFYARSYIDALNIAFTPLAQFGATQNTTKRNNLAVLADRAQAKSSELARAA